MTAVAHKYIKQSILLIAAMFLLSLLYIQLCGDREVMIVPLVVTVVFQLVCCLVYGLLWKRIAVSSPETLPTLYMSASGLRILAGAITVLLFCFLAGDKASIRFFIIIFLIYYFIILIYDTVYFVSVEKKSKKI